jgi:hypothetical protein
MKRILLILIMLLAGTALNAAFKDSAWSVRAMGQGGCFSAATDDPSALFYNPAGIAYLERKELGLMYNMPFTGLDEVKLGRSSLACALPTLSAGTFGIGWSSMEGTSLYREDAFLLSYAGDISRLFYSDIGTAAFGVSAKYLRRGYTLDERTTDDPVFLNGSSRSAMTADAGIIVHPMLPALPGLDLGLSVKNLLPADMGFAKIENVPIETRLGGVYYWTPPWDMYSVSFSGEIVQRNDELTYSAGGECWVTTAFALRAGASSHEAACGISGEFPIGGIALRLDYAFLFPFNVEGSAGSHAASLSLRF